MSLMLFVRRGANVDVKPKQEAAESNSIIIETEHCSLSATQN